MDVDGVGTGDLDLVGGDQPERIRDIGEVEPGIPRRGIGRRGRGIDDAVVRDIYGTGTGEGYLASKYAIHVGIAPDVDHAATRRDRPVVERPVRHPLAGEVAIGIEPDQIVTVAQ